MLGYTLALPLAILASTASAQLNGLRATIPGESCSLPRVAAEQKTEAVNVNTV